MLSSSIEISYERCYLCGLSLQMTPSISEKYYSTGRSERPKLVRMGAFRDLREYQAQIDAYADDETSFDDPVYADNHYECVKSYLNGMESEYIRSFGECVGFCDKKQ